LFILLNKIHW